MKRKIFSVLFALVLLASLGLVTAVPAGAQGTASLNLRTYGDGVAEWSTDLPRSGGYSVLLDAGTLGGANAGRIEVWVDPIAMADFTGASYYVWEPNGTQHGGEFPYVNAHPYGDPYINIYLDLNEDGIYDECLEGLGSIEYGTSQQPATHPAPALETWVRMEEGYGFYDSNNGLGQGTWVTAHAVGTLTEWKDYLATKYLDPPVQVVGVKITFGFWADEVTPDVYVDDVEINGVTYDLEQPAAVWVDDTDSDDANPGTEAKPFLTIQHAIDILADGTVNVAAGTYYENVIIDESVTIQGAGVGSSIVDGGGSGSVFLIGTNDDTVSVAISDMTIQNGGGNPHSSLPSLTFGGGIFTKADLTLNDAVVTNNQASYSGGGIASYSTLQVNRCTISDNTIDTSINGPSGGGIKTYGTTSIIDSTISGNTCVSSGTGGSGGGIMSLAYQKEGWPGDLTMTNCTVSGNTVDSAGGGICSQDGDMTLTNLTITGNSVTGGNNQGGGIFIYGGTHVVKNTIVAGNTASVGPPNIMKGTCTWTASNCITSGDPLLGLLQDNGGSTETHALLLGSPAIDTGDDIVCPATDQRGVPRPQGPASSDIGSYEVPYTVYIDDDWTGPEDCGGHVWGADAFAIIQDGINPVAEGGTVDVAVGTYNEAITIDKGLTLEGAQAGEDPTVEEARTDSAEESTIQGSGGAAVTISADDVTIDGFQIENPTGYAGIRADGRSYITIKNNIVTNIDGVGSGTGNQGIAIVGSATPITDITIEDNQVNGIKHTAVDRSATGIWIGNSSGSSTISKVVIQRNTVSNIFANTSAWGSGGYGAYGILINYGAYNIGDTVNAQVLDNTISNLEGLWAHGIGLEGNTPGAVVERNDISHLIDHKTPSDAVAVQVEDNPSAATLTIEFNSVYKVNVGVQNVVVGNPLVTAENNWWGHSSGTVTVGNVDIDPWLLTTEGLTNEKVRYDKTLSLPADWSIVSPDAELEYWIPVDAEPLMYAYDGGGFTTEFILDPVTPIFIKAGVGGGGIGFNYATSSQGIFTTNLEAGWNLIGVPQTGASDEAILSSIRLGANNEVALATLASQGNYNPSGETFYESMLNPLSVPPTLYPFDGYWAYMNVVKEFGVVVVP